MPSLHHWQKLKDFVQRNGLSNNHIWLGGSGDTDKAKEGEWSWTDGSKWSVEQWAPGEPLGISDWNCLRLTSGLWYGSSCNLLHLKYRSICSVPITATFTSSTQVVFTSENICYLSPVGVISNK